MHSQGGMRALWAPVWDSPGAPSLTLGSGAEEGEQGLLGSGLGAGDGGRSVCRRAGLGGLWVGEERQSLGVGTDQLVP